MKKRIVIGFFCCIVVAGSAFASQNNAGSVQDPLISLSYAESTYSNQIASSAQSIANTVLNPVYANASANLQAVSSDFSTSAINAELAEKVIAAYYSKNITTETLSASGSITCTLGTEITILHGGLSVTSGTLVNLSSGGTCNAGSNLVVGHQYLVSETGAVLRSSTASTTLQVSSGYTITDASPIRYTAYAEALQSLGLFSGTELGYELGRASTRAEGIVMLIRLMGAQSTAASQNLSHPFTDVPSWVSPYVGYAYRNNLSSGISSTQFGSSSTLRLNDYATFLLRALGYSDANGDFSWATASETAISMGLLTQSEYTTIVTNGFRRDDIVLTSLRALQLQTKQGGTLASKLIANGTFTTQAWLQALEKISG